MLQNKVGREKKITFTFTLDTNKWEIILSVQEQEKAKKFLYNVINWLFTVPLSDNTTMILITLIFL